MPGRERRSLTPLRRLNAYERGVRWALQSCGRASSIAGSRTARLAERTSRYLSAHGQVDLERHDQLRADRDPDQAVQRGAAQERVVQPARRPHHGPHPLPEGVRGRPARRSPTSTSSRATRSPRAATSSSTPTSSSRSSRRPRRRSSSRSSSTSTEIDPVYFETAYYVAPAPQPEAVRAAGPGDGGSRQGGDRPVRDAQQAVHGGDPRRSTAGW